MSFVILTVISAVIWVFTVCACPETYAPVILSRLAATLRVETGDDRIVSRLEFEEMASRGTPALKRFKAEASRVLKTPFVMLFSESIGASLLKQDPSLFAWLANLLMVQ